MKGLLLLLVLLLCSAVTSQSQGPINRSSADLPALLVFDDRTPVESKRAWPRRRNEIRNLMLEHFTGFPPSDTPVILNSKITGSRIHADGSTRRRISLTLNTPNKFTFEIHVWIPSGNKQPRPLLLTQPRDYQLPWAEMALKRGYLVCLYPGVDSHHREKDYPGYDSILRLPGPRSSARHGSPVAALIIFSIRNTITKLRRSKLESSDSPVTESNH